MSRMNLPDKIIIKIEKTVETYDDGDHVFYVAHISGEQVGRESVDLVTHGRDMVDAAAMAHECLQIASDYCVNGREHHCFCRKAVITRISHTEEAVQAYECCQCHTRTMVEVFDGDLVTDAQR